MFTSCPSFFNQDVLVQITQSNYTRIIFSVEFKPEQLFQQDVFLDFLVFLWTFWPPLRINET